MTVVPVDAGVLTSGRPALDVTLSELLDGPTCLRFEGNWPAAVDRGVIDTLRAVPALVIGVGAAVGEVAGALDLVVADHDAASSVIDAFSRAPLAAVSGALLLRHPAATIEAGLVAESTTYSMLQGGPEFAAWRAAHRPNRDLEAPAPRVRVERERSLTVVSLTRPAKHNALDVAMRDELYDALTDARWSRGPVALLGDGPSFCSGGDLDEFASFPDPVHAHLVRLDRSLAACCAALSDRLVVGLHGACLGAGIELPAFAAHVVAADDASIGLPEQGIGLVPGAGGTVSIPRRTDRHATLSLLLRDGTITALQAREWGLVDEVVPARRLRARVLEIAESLA